METEASDLLRVELRRTPFASAEPARTALGALSVFLLALAAVVELAPGLPLGIHLRAVVGLFVVVGSVWLVMRIWKPQPIAVRSTGLVLPRLSLPGWRVEVAMDDVYDARATSDGEGVALGVTGRLPIRYRATRFVRGLEDARALVDTVRDAVAEGPLGSERLEAFDARARLASSWAATPWATYALVVVLLAVYLVQLANGATPLDPARLVQFGANAPVLLARGEVYRLVTANLLHGSVGHLYMNALLLLILGSRLEGLLGTARCVLVIVAAALGGALVSDLVGASTLSLGASTMVAGVVGGLTYLNVARRDELPAGIRAPLWLFLVIGAAQTAIEVTAENVDHGAHIGGLAAGWLATAVVVGRTRLTELDEENVVGVRIGLAVALAGVLAGCAWGAARAARPDPESQALVGERLLERTDLPHAVVNNFAWTWADDPATPRPRIARARASMERVVRSDPRIHDFWDTYALVSWRDGHLDDAIIGAWNAKVLFDNPVYGRRLAEYQVERASASGPLYLGPGSRFQPHFAIDWPEEGAPGDRGIRMRLPAALPNGAAIHALLYRDGILHGHLELWLGPTGVVEHAFNDAESQAPLDGDIEFRTVLVDTRPKGLLPGVRALQVWIFP